jgi:hypothetical protein
MVPSDAFEKSQPRLVSYCRAGVLATLGLFRTWEEADAASAVDKAKNKLEELGGKLKEAIGKVSGDER